MKSIPCFAIAILVTTRLTAQKVEQITELPFPAMLVSSEATLAHSPAQPEKLVATVLGVNPSALTPDYRTIVLASDDFGSQWRIIPQELPNEAADPWVVALGNHQFVVADISEGNRFHLKTHHFSEERTVSMASHGTGHDYGTIIPKDQGYFLVSTQKEGGDRTLYAARYDPASGLFEKRSYPLFNGSDFSVKRPVLWQNKMLIPVTLRGQIKGESVDYFTEMTTWLLTLNWRENSLSPPALITSRSGAKHHQLILDEAGVFYFLYTNIERSRIEITTRRSGSTWTAPALIREGDYLVNLDAALWVDSHLYAVYTVEESPGLFQKWVSVITGSLKVVRTIKLGPPSQPDESNGWALRAWPQGGDYCGLIQYEDQLVVLWSAAPNQKFKPYMAKIKLP